MAAWRDSILPARCTRGASLFLGVDLTGLVTVEGALLDLEGSLSRRMFNDA
jgi:hypothetical protein